MWNAYPSGSASKVKAAIGGNVDAAWIANTCTIRISKCFNAAGVPIPRNHDGLTTVRGGDNLRYAFRVREFRAFLEETYGAATRTISREAGGMALVHGSAS